MRKYNKTGFRAETRRKISKQGQIEEYLDSLLLGQMVMVIEDGVAKEGEVIQKNKTCVYVKSKSGVICISIGELITGQITLGGIISEAIDN